MNVYSLRLRVHTGLFRKKLSSDFYVQSLQRRPGDDVRNVQKDADVS